MITSLGRYLRKLRMDRDELLKDMADKLGLASSTLSSIENGRRKPPKGFEEKLSKAYDLSKEQIDELKWDMMLSKDEVALSIGDLNQQDRTLAVSFARRFENLSEADKARIREILNEAD